MQSRLNSYDITPDLVQKAVELQKAIESAGVDPALLELVKIRASQINGCAYCLHMHTSDALKRGETAARIFVLSGWRESTLFSPRERAVLAWTETLTHVAERGAPDALYETMRELFTDKEIVALTSAIAMINFWNRTAIALAYVHPSEQRKAG